MKCVEHEGGEQLVSSTDRWVIDFNSQRYVSIHGARSPEQPIAGAGVQTGVTPLSLSLPLHSTVHLAPNCPNLQNPLCLLSVPLPHTPKPPASASLADSAREIQNLPPSGLLQSSHHSSASHHSPSRSFSILLKYNMHQNPCNRYPDSKQMGEEEEADDHHDSVPDATPTLPRSNHYFQGLLSSLPPNGADQLPRALSHHPRCRTLLECIHSHGCGAFRRVDTLTTCSFYWGWALGREFPVWYKRDTSAPRGFTVTDLT